MSKEHSNVLLCCNTGGSEKQTPLVIGHAKKPRCFKNIKTFPTIYKANRKAWIRGVKALSIAELMQSPLDESDDE